MAVVLLVMLAILGCGTKETGADHWQEFPAKWRAASVAEKKQMVDLQAIHARFKSSGPDDIKGVFGPPQFEGKDDFGTDVIRYEFDAVPDTDGKIKQCLTFALENGKVVRVEANILP